MQKGTSTGVLDEFFAAICVGDEIVDKAGRHYTVDRFGRAKPTDGGNEMPLKELQGLTICKGWLGGSAETVSKKTPKLKVLKNPENEEEENLRAIKEAVKDAGDQTLVDELRSRGWVVKCTKMIEKVVFEEVAL